MAAAAAAAALERLEALGCPPLPPLSPPQALGLLCSPSAQRLLLLEGLCCRVYPPLAAHLDPDAPKDARVRELAKLGEQLMLCRADDLALVEGTAPPEQQLEFIGDLLDAAPPPLGEGKRDPPLSRPITRFLFEVLETPEGGAALSPPEPPPLPTFDPYDNSPLPRKPPPPRPPQPDLEASLGGARRCWELLEAQNPELGGSRQPPPPILPTLGVVGGDLVAMATAFGVSELGDPPGTPPETPPHAPCGALAPPVCRGLRQLLQGLRVVSQLGDTAAEVTRLGGGPQHQLMASRVTSLRRRFGDIPKTSWGAPPN